MKKIIPDSGSFRDPSGIVYRMNDDYDSSKIRIVRGINKDTYNQHIELLDNEIFKNFVSEGKIVGTKIIDLDEEICKELYPAKWHSFLEHQAIDLISYPYEWSFSQLKDAAILHLELLLEFLESGWIIKDSTPYNIQFVNNKPVFIDTPSIIKWEEGSGWDAYRQFCTLFLYPLMLENHLDIDYRPLLKSNLDGIEPNFMYKVLGLRKLFKRGVLSHVFLPHSVEKRILVKEKNKTEAQNRTNIRQSKLSVIAIVDSMLGIIKKMNSKSSISAWADYDHINTYEKNDNNIKNDFIEKVCSNNNFNIAWDLGANTGMFSEHISKYVNHVVAIDGDSIAVDKMYSRLKKKDTNIHPLILNIQNMSPNHGFDSSERIKLENRSKPDLVMCLAVIHHIRIAANIPCENFLNYLRNMNTDVIIEFVNRNDEMVEKLLLNKKEKYLDYNIENFIKFANTIFTTEETIELKGGKRVLFHLSPK
jgi:hypothetical protein